MTAFHILKYNSPIANWALPIMTCKRISNCLISIILIIMSFDLMASKTISTDELITMMQHVLKDNTRYQQALNQGEQRITLCRYCHGKNGISKKETIPNLAAQNSEYLIRQFELFANNTRKDRVMSELAKNLSRSDKVNVALYYSSQEASRGQDYAGGSKEQGRTLFVKQCASCHGLDGYGKQDLPRIAGQPPAYVIKTLRLYKNGSLTRPDSPMQAITAQLSDDDIQSVTAYVSAMR